MARKRIAEQTKGIGKPKVGGPFQLVDHNGNPFSNEDMLGKYSLVCKRGERFLRYDMLSITGLLWLHTLPRHLPRRTRQDGTHVRQGGRGVR